MKKLWTLFFLLLGFLIITPRDSFALNSFYSFDAKQYYFDVAKTYFDGPSRCDLISDLSARSACLENPRNGKTFESHISDYDMLVFLTSLQGLVNRYKPTFYLLIQSVDDEWLRRLKTAGIWLQDATETRLSSIDDLINTFRHPRYGIQGSVVWDDTKPFTLNLATTIAGAENLVIVRNNMDSGLFNKITSQFPVRHNLSGRFEKKTDAYEWLVNNYLKTGKVQPIPAYHKDGLPLNIMKYYRKMFLILDPNKTDSAESWGFLAKDRYIAKKVFTFDLAPAANVVPGDVGFGTGAEQFGALQNIFTAARERVGANKMMEVWGFPNRNYFRCTGEAETYYNGYNGVVCAENPFTDFVTRQGAHKMLGEEYFGPGESSNGSFFMHGPGPDYIPQNAPLTPDQLINRAYVIGNPNDPNSLQLNRNKKYVMIYQGDYDMSNHTIPSIVNPTFTGRRTWDSRDGSIPIAWGISAIHVRDVPPIYKYLIATMSGGDWFVMPDSGIGYMNPEVLPQNYLDDWMKQTTNLNRAFNYRSGWILNGKNISTTLHGNNNPTRDAIKKIAPEGVFFSPASDGENVINKIDDGFTVLNGFNVDTYDETVGQLQARWNSTPRQSSRYQADPFIVGRTVAVDVGNLSRALAGRGEEFVDPNTFFALHRLSLGGGPTIGRSTVTNHSVQGFMVKGQIYNVTVTLRNDGWDTWNPNEVKIGWGLKQGVVNPVGRGGIGPQESFPYDSNPRRTLSRSIAPGESDTVTIPITAPPTTGSYSFQVDFVKEGQYWFEQKGNVPWQKVVRVVDYNPDVKTDGKANYEDIEEVLQQYGQIENNARDVNRDGKVNAVDVVKVNQQIIEPMQNGL